MPRNGKQYSYKKHPTSRAQEEIQQGQDLNVNMTTLQLNFLFSNLGNLLLVLGWAKGNRCGTSPQTPTPSGCPKSFNCRQEAGLTSAQRTKVEALPRRNTRNMALSCVLGTSIHPVSFCGRSAGHRIHHCTVRR